jgi:hypothetical protein
MPTKRKSKACRHHMLEIREDLKVQAQANIRELQPKTAKSAGRQKLFCER